MRWWDATINTEVPADFFSSPVVGLHSVGRFISGRFCRVCLGTGEFPRPQGSIPPGLYPLQGCWVYCLAPEAPPKRVMPTGPKVFLALTDACGLRPCDRAHLKKRPCAIFVRWWDATINTEVPADFFSSPVVGLHSVGRFISGRFCRMCLGTGEFLRPQGAIPPGLYPLRGGWVYCLAPEAPQKGECRRRRRYFWPCRTRVGFSPATGPTLKTALCHIRALVGRKDKIQRSPRTFFLEIYVWHETLVSS